MAIALRTESAIKTLSEHLFTLPAQQTKDLLRNIFNADPSIDLLSIFLVCPMTNVRIKKPCRSMSCVHVQCFEAESYLSLQWEHPVYICPVCDRQTAFKFLIIDEYFAEILSKTDRDCTEVLLKPDGSWIRADTYYRELDQAKDLTDATDRISIIICDGDDAPVVNRQTKLCSASTTAENRPRQDADVTILISDDEDTRPGNVISNKLRSISTTSENRPTKEKRSNSTPIFIDLCTPPRNRS